MPIWMPILINGLGLTIIGSLWWAYTGKRLVIFHGRDNLESTRLSIRMRSHCIGLLSMLVLVSVHLFQVVDLLSNQWLNVIPPFVGGTYFFWCKSAEVGSQ